MTGMPSPRNSAAGPTPDNCSSCGDCNAPADRMTSRSASALNVRAFADPLHTGRDASPKRNLADLCVGDDCQIWPMRDRLQEGRRRTGAPMPADAELVAADAVRRLAVEIRDCAAVQTRRRLRPRLRTRRCCCADWKPRTRRGRHGTGFRRPNNVRSAGNTAAIRGSSIPPLPADPNHRSPHAGRE